MDLREKLQKPWRDLFRGVSRVVVATSGGPDSQALLDLLARGRQDLSLEGFWAVGVNHGLRVEAASELELAQQLALRHGVAFHSVDVAVSTKGNLLAQARKARYQALLQFVEDHRAQALAVAHTATDQAETLLFRLVRGSALRGASGMRPQTGKVLRPLLDITRPEVMTYLSDRGIAYAEDPSNRHPRFSRSEIRQNVLPRLAQLNPQVVTHMAKYCRLVQADEAFLESQAQAHWPQSLGPNQTLKMAHVRAMPWPLASRLLRHWLEHHGLQGDHQDLCAIWEGLQQPNFGYVCGGYHIFSERDLLWIAPERLRSGLGQTQNDYDERLDIPGDVVIRDPYVHVRAACQDRQILVGDQFRSCNDRQRVAFGAECTHNTFVLRSWRPGDRFQPFGMQGHVKVSDLLTNMKIPRALRRGWPVLAHGKDIAWVVGLRRGAWAPVTERSEKITLFEVKPGAFFESVLR